MIKEYKKKDGSKAYMFVAYLGVDPITGKQKRTTRRGFKTKRDAKIAEARLQAEIEENGFSVKPKQMTFQEVYDVWLPVYKATVKESTYQVQKDVIRLHILPKFGTLKVNTITTLYCQRTVNEWAEKYKKVPNLIGLTQRILEFARTSLKLIKDNPMKDVVRPKQSNVLNDNKYRAPFYNAKQLQEFLDKVKEMDPQQSYVVFRLIAYTGMREGEVCGLKWIDFDEVNETLTVRRTVARGEDYKKIIQNPKTKAGTRIIALDSETASILKWWRNEQRKLMLYLGYNTNSPDQFIITNDKNEFQYAQYPYALLKKLRKKFDIPPITVHGLRHTHCTLLIEAGASIKEAQERMGHENTEMVLEVYTHVNQQRRNKLGNNFASLIEKSN